MLAKEVKTTLIMRQRKFIEEGLKERAKAKNGDPSYSYMGQIFSENISYFEAQGYVVSRFCCNSDVRLTMGKYMYVFNVSNKIELSEEELKLAEAETVDCDEKLKLAEAETVDWDKEDMIEEALEDVCELLEGYLDENGGPRSYT